MLNVTTISKDVVFSVLNKIEAIDGELLSKLIEKYRYSDVPTKTELLKVLEGKEFRLISDALIEILKIPSDPIFISMILQKVDDVTQQEILNMLKLNIIPDLGRPR